MRNILLAKIQDSNCNSQEWNNNEFANSATLSPFVKPSLEYLNIIEQLEMSFA
jgi:hypothetical protein